jgi:hypothetical protein
MTLTEKRILAAQAAGRRAKNLKFKAFWGRVVLALEKGRQEP